MTVRIPDVQCGCRKHGALCTSTGWQSGKCGGDLPNAWACISPPSFACSHGGRKLGCNRSALVGAGDEACGRSTGCHRVRTDTECRSAGTAKWVGFGVGSKSQTNLGRTRRQMVDLGFPVNNGRRKSQKDRDWCIAGRCIDAGGGPCQHTGTHRRAVVWLPGRLMLRACDTAARLFSGRGGK